MTNFQRTAGIGRSVTELAEPCSTPRSKEIAQRGTHKLLDWARKKLRPIYHRYFLNFHTVKALEWRVLKGWIKPRNNLMLLDVGSGNGQYIRKLQHSAEYIVGIDRNIKGITSAYAYNRPGNAAYMVGDALSLPFRDRTFDFALCICALEHFADNTAAIREINRVLKKMADLF